MKTLVIIPTYNELETLKEQVLGVRQYAPEVDILIADDNSPDGTGKLADQLAAQDNQIYVLHRAGKQGLGDAYMAGFKWGLARGYELLCEMDADGSHRAKDFPRLLRRANRPDQPGLVIGSRWVPGGSVVNWPWHRKVLSKGGNDYVALMLGIKVKDATAGFRVYRAETLEVIHLDEVESHGYCFQVDMTWRTITGFHLHRGALAAMRRQQLPAAAELISAAASSGRPSRIAIFEDIVDHTNLGALFRSAAALGIDAVLISPSCADPLYRRSIRVSMGAVFQVPWARLETWPASISLLHDVGYVVAALGLSSDAIPLADLTELNPPKLALILGTEGDGLKPRTLAAADLVVKIPMSHGVDSLNVAAASAVAFYATQPSDHTP